MSDRSRFTDSTTSSETQKHKKKKSTSSVSYRRAQNASYKPVSTKRKRRHTEEEYQEPS